MQEYRSTGAQERRSIGVQEGRALRCRQRQAQPSTVHAPRILPVKKSQHVLESLPCQYHPPTAYPTAAHPAYPTTTYPDYFTTSLITSPRV